MKYIIYKYVAVVNLTQEGKMLRKVLLSLVVVSACAVGSDSDTEELHSESTVMYYDPHHNLKQAAPGVYENHKKLDYENHEKLWGLHKAQPTYEELKQAYLTRSNENQTPTTQPIYINKLAPEIWYEILDFLCGKGMKKLFIGNSSNTIQLQKMLDFMNAEQTFALQLTGFISGLNSIYPLETEMCKKFGSPLQENYAQRLRLFVLETAYSSSKQVLKGVGSKTNDYSFVDLLYQYFQTSRHYETISIPTMHGLKDLICCCMAFDRKAASHLQTIINNYIIWKFHSDPHIKTCTDAYVQFWLEDKMYQEWTTSQEEGREEYSYYTHTCYVIETQLKSDEQLDFLCTVLTKHKLLDEGILWDYGWRIIANKIHEPIRFTFHSNDFTIDQEPVNFRNYYRQQL